MSENEGGRPGSAQDTAETYTSAEYDDVSAVSNGEIDSLRGRLRRYAQVGRSMTGLAAQFVGNRYLGVELDSVKHSSELRQALGGIKYGPTDAEKPSMRFRRSLYIAKDMKAGDVLTAENLRIIRPGYGLAPKYYEVLLGQRVNRDLEKGTAVEWGMVG